MKANSAPMPHGMVEGHHFLQRLRQLFGAPLEVLVEPTVTFPAGLRVVLLKLL